MGKVEQSFVEPMRKMDLNQAKMNVPKRFKQFQLKMELLFLQKGLALLIIGFLLGRAFILTNLTPFALPFFAAVYLARRDKTPHVFLGLLAGAMTISLANVIYIFASGVVFLFIFRTFIERHKNEVKVLPYYVLSITFLGKLTFVYLQQGKALSTYHVALIGMEAGLACILTFIFLQSIPLIAFHKRKKVLKTEEVISIIILLASVMTGTIGWSVYNLSIEHILSRYLVILFAFAGGAAVGSTVGVVTGIIFSLANVGNLYQISLLAFSGLLGGLLKEGKRTGVAFGLLLATLLIGLYGEGNTPLLQTMYESGSAILLLLLTPFSLINKLAKYIPGTPEYAQDQQQYLKKVRDITVNRVEQFSSVFKALSNSFSQTEQKFVPEENREFDYFLSNVTEKTCQTCFKKEQCWVNQFHTTYDLMKEIMHDLDENDHVLSQKYGRKLEQHCNRANKVKLAMLHELSFFQANQKLKKQVKESRKLVAEQLLGVSEVMGDFAKEIQRERENHHKQEEEIFEMLQDFGIDIEQVEIFSLEKGGVDIEMTIPFCEGLGESEKLIAPLLSDILGETIIVQKEVCAEYSNGYCYVTFSSAKAFAVETGVAHAAKGGGIISGDSYATIELGAGKFAIAISDGMGNGERAHHESNETLLLLKKILKSGIEEQVAIKSVNSILSLRTTDEIFSTLDLAVIDLQHAKMKCMKICSTPSFIKRGTKVIKVEAGNLPMGILQDFDIEVVSKQLKAGDVLIMMSDGIFEGPNHVENHEIWMKRKIRQMETNEPQEIADLIMEEVIRGRSGYIDDDMTIIVARIDHNTPKWSTIPISKRKALIS
ncbi:stage II sporulation protein E [Bacillus chungangensis]|uniref:Stage II sporulation protein E n=1 Tax=Bacillus chungangensis TaxID=587633 RepID=A0ABT9WX64_9BACI|nr:stage II sporulation protein E [Bacillus chungangensis]MDQ0177891.1 stage II sporulation protein E [Bacillus chungangensis]